MAGPLGVLPAGPVVVTTKVGQDVDGGPLRGAANGSGIGHHRSWRRCRWWAPGVLPACLAAATTEVGEDVDSGPLGGAIIGSGSGHHRS
jgi:hypothetical protein